MFHRPTSHSAAIGPGCAGPPLSVPTSAVLDHVPTHVALEPVHGGQAFAVDPQLCSSADPTQRTQNPYVTGTSVLAFVYKDGILIACDTLGSYGSTKRYKSLQRIVQINPSTVLAAAGEISDFQYIQRLLDELATDDFCEDDGITLSAREVHAYLTRVLYNRRNKFDPLWNSLVVGGFVGDIPYLATVGMIGTSFADTNIATGFGQMLARPLFREVDTTTLDEAAAVELMHKALKVCYYRDKQSINKFQMARITKQGIAICEPFSLETNWEFKLFASDRWRSFDNALMLFSRFVSAATVFVLVQHAISVFTHEWPLCDIIEGNLGTTLNLTAPANGILNLLTDETPWSRYVIHARLTGDASAEHTTCLGIAALALAADATRVLVTAAKPMLLRIDDTVIDLAPYMRETLAMSAAHPVYIDTAVSIHLLHKAAYATVFEDYGLRGEWLLIVALADYDILVAQLETSLQLVVQLHDNAHTYHPRRDAHLSTLEGLVAYMLDCGLGPPEPLLVNAAGPWLGVRTWDTGVDNHFRKALLFQ